MRKLLLIAALTLAGAGSADAQPRPPAPSWDSRGWISLGERTVNGDYDHDRIEVGRSEGRFAKLTMVVENSDLELIDFKVVFGDRSEFHPSMSHWFREGQRSRVVELPESVRGARVIKYVDIRYRNLRARDARVQLWGFRVGDSEPPPPPPPVEVAPPPPPPPPPPAWDQRGWTLLGEKRVDSHREDFDKIEVARWEPRFHKLSLVVLDADMELIDMVVKFKHADPFHPDVRQFFREGSRARVIELPDGEERTIRWIEFRYRNLPGEGRARVQVWAK